MRFQYVATVLSSVYALSADASVLKLDISHNGDIDLELDTSTVSKPDAVFNAGIAAAHRVASSTVDDDFIVDIWPGKHKGFLDATVRLCLIF
jgi:hypothetical protein